MQILVIGKNSKAAKIADKLAENKEDIVFTNSSSKISNRIEINQNNEKELKDFILANEIGLLIPIELEDNNFEEILSETECLIVQPDISVDRICKSTSAAKKFAYKNKIQVPKFACFEKMQTALDYINDVAFPIIIETDIVNDTEVPFIAETKSKARKTIEDLFNTGNRKILIEEFTGGVIYTKYIITDGFCALNLFETYSYFEDFSINDTRFLKDKAKSKIENEITLNILNSFMEDGTEHKGIFGVSFFIDKNNEPEFFRFLPFIKEGDIEIFLNTLKTPLRDLFLYCAEEGVLEKSEIEFNDKISLSFFDESEKLKVVTSNTMNGALKLAEFEGADKKIIDEAIRQFKL